MSKKAREAREPDPQRLPSEHMQILEICGDPAFCVSAEGRIVYANGAAAAFAERRGVHLPPGDAADIDARLRDWPTFFAGLEERGAVLLETSAEHADSGPAAHALHARIWRPPGGPFAIVVLRDDRGHVQEQMAGLARRDAILQAASASASRYLADDDWDASCNALLKDMGEATGVSRVYIFEAHFDDQDQLYFSQRYEWVAAGIEPQIDNPELQNLPLEAAGFGRWQDLLSRGKLLAGRVRDFPGSEQDLLESQSILSLAVVPIFTGSRWWGMMGFDECTVERDWGVAETEALRMVAGLFGLARERRDAAARAREKQDSLVHEARLIAMGGIASSIAHEINQPLSAISNYCETGLAALEARVEDRGVLLRAFGGAAGQARRAGEIIRRLREFLSKGDTTRTAVDVNELIDETLKLVEHEARAKRITVIVDAASGLQKIRVCRVQIQQVLFNLFRNAIESIEEGAEDAPRVLRVSSEKPNRLVQRVRVADTGPGVPPEIRDRLFEPFETSKSGGMGLGLSISRTLIEAHGGSLTLDPGCRDAACFQIDLPCTEFEDDE